MQVRNYTVKSILLIALPTSFLFVGGLTALRSAVYPHVVSAAQPPPPVNYTLTISKVGGDDNCQISATPPTPVQWSSTTIQRTYTNLTTVALKQKIDCPSEYEFDHWESNEDSIDGNVDLFPPIFNISKDTWAKAHFVAVTPRVVNFQKTSENLATVGDYTVTYSWGSSSGNLADLSNQEIFEVVAYDLSLDFDDVQNFLCTSLSRTESVDIGAPWNEMFEDTPGLKRSSGDSAVTGTCPDNHTRAYKPASCTNQCSYSIRQWYVAQDGAGSRYYLVGGPYLITRSFHMDTQNIWQYCIEKHGPAACTPKIW